MRRSVFFLSIVLSSVGVRAGGQAGTAALPYLEEGVGARSLGMGGAYGALAEGADALFWNPAGLAERDSSELLLNHQPLIEFMSLDVGSFAMPLGSSRLGFAYTQMKSDAIGGFDGSGNPTGSFRVKDQLITAGYARAMKGWRFGFSGKSIRSNLGDASASSMAADAGVNFANPFFENVSHAVVIQNMGGSLGYGNDSNALPLLLRLATAVHPTRRVSVGFDLTAPRGGAATAALGSELTIPLANEAVLMVRAGYGTSQKDIGGVAGLGIGGGIQISGLRLDMAWLPEGDFGSNEIFTLTFAFGKTGLPSEAGAPMRVAAPPVLLRPQPLTRFARQGS